MLSLADFGFSSAVTRQAAHSLHLVVEGTPRHHGEDLIETEPGWPGVSDLYAASRLIFWRVTIVAAVFLIVLFHAVLPFTRLILHPSFGTALTYYALGISVLLNLQLRLPLAILDGVGYMFVSRIILGSYGLLWNVGSVFSLLIAPSLVSMSVAVLACSVLQYAAMHFALRCVAGRQIDFHVPASKPLANRLWKVALPFGIVNSGVYLIGAVQVPLLGAVVGPAAVSPYYIAARITQTLNAAVQQITQTQMPLFTQQLAGGCVADAGVRMIRTLWIATVLYAAGSIFLYFVSPSLVSAWVGPRQYVSAVVLFLVTLNFLIAGITTVPGQFVLAAGSNPFAVSTLIQGGLSVIGVIALCPRMGISGVPLASLLAGLVTNYWYNPARSRQLWHLIQRTALPPLRAAGRGTMPLTQGFKPVTDAIATKMVPVCPACGNTGSVLYKNW